MTVTVAPALTLRLYQLVCPTTSNPGAVVPTETDVWFPVADTVTVLPDKPAYDTEPELVPANSAVVDDCFDPDSVDVQQLFNNFIPAGDTDAVYDTSANVTSLIQPKNELIPIRYRLRSILVVLQADYSIKPQVSEVSLTLKPFVSGQSYQFKVSTMPGEFTYTGIAASLYRAIVARAGQFIIAGNDANGEINPAVGVGITVPTTSILIAAPNIQVVGAQSKLIDVPSASINLQVIAPSILSSTSIDVPGAIIGITAHPPNVPTIASFYEVFTASGTWDWEAAGSPSTVDVLLVAGGGGGGSRQGGGGGGAGGLKVVSDLTVSGNVSVTVGVGGAGGPNTAATDGQKGGDTSFGSESAEGGGGGGLALASSVNTVGKPGGSGGGAGRSGTSTVGGAGTLGQGNDGGANLGTNDGAGGGGGASQAGEDRQSTRAGNGGDGLTLESIGWGDAIVLGAPSAVGGGGGGGSTVGTGHASGAGGLGGGGAGAGSAGITTAGDGEDGAANTGGGGGGAQGSGTSNRAGGSGGSGLVIVRWVGAA